MKSERKVADVGVIEFFEKDPMCITTEHSIKYVDCGIFIKWEHSTGEKIVEFYSYKIIKKLRIVEFINTEEAK